MYPVKALLLDVDGTLIDSNDQHAHAWVDAFEEMGDQVEYARVRRLIGMGGDNLVEEILGLGPDDKKSKKLSKIRGEIFRKNYLASVKAFPQTEELLKVLKAKSYELVIATSASEKDLKALLSQCGLEGLVEKAVTASDAESSKPDPDIILAALSRYNLSPQSTVMLGDTPYDIQASAKANVKAIALTCGGWDEQTLVSEGAMKVFKDPSHLLDSVKKAPITTMTARS